MFRYCSCKLLSPSISRPTRPRRRRARADQLSLIILPKIKPSSRFDARGIADEEEKEKKEKEVVVVVMVMVIWWLPGVERRHGRATSPRITNDDAGRRMFRVLSPINFFSPPRKHRRPMEQRRGERN